MLSALKSWFGRLAGGGAGTAPEAAGEPVEYKGYRIRPAPYSAEGGYQTAGVIEKDGESGPREHRFVRAERHPSKDEALAFSVAKAKQIIDQQGERIFDK
jgi:hypothetical protein